MGLLDKVNKQKAKPKQEINYTDLESEELKYLLGLIARSEFIGKDLQVVYSITAKLQNQLNK